MQVIVDGLMTNYERVGSGRVILCLPGWGDTVTSFRELSGKLKDKYTVISLDLPGFGGTQAPSKAWGLEDYAKFTADFLKKMHHQKVFALIGHSYGGATAIVSVGSGYTECQKLILLSSSGIRDRANLRKNSLKFLTKIAKAPLYLLPNQTKRKLRKKVYSAVGSDMMLLPHMEPTFRKIINEDVRPDAAKIKTDTFLIYGSEDSQTPVKYGRLLDDVLPNSKIAVIQGADHLIHLNNTDETAKLIRQFLKEKA